MENNSALIAAVLVFIAAMITLYVTNRRADQREWNKWRRDTLIRICTDAVDASYETEAAYRHAISLGPDEFKEVRFSAASRAASRMNSVAEQLNLVGSHYLADACREMKASADAIDNPAWTLRHARQREKAANQEADDTWEKQHPDDNGSETISNERTMSKARNMIAAFNGLVRGPLSDFDASTAHLDSARSKFIRRGQIELRNVR